MSVRESARDRRTTAALVVLLGLALLAVGLVVGGVLLWLVGPVVTVLLCLVAGAVYAAVRAARAS